MGYATALYGRAEIKAKALDFSPKAGQNSLWLDENSPKAYFGQPQAQHGDDLEIMADIKPQTIAYTPPRLIPYPIRN